MSDAADRIQDETAGDSDDHAHDGDEHGAPDILADFADVVAPAAAQLRQGAKDVELQEATAGGVTLVACGYFNQLGPTAHRIDAIPVPDTGETLLVSASDHQMHPDCWALALITPEAANAAAMREVLAPIFATNGRWNEWLRLGGVPSYVHLEPGSPVDYACAAELLRSAIAVAAGMFGDALDYGNEIQDLVRAWQDPGSQAAEAVNRSLQGPEAQRLVARIRQLEAGLQHDDHDAKDPTTTMERVPPTPTNSSIYGSRSPPSRRTSSASRGNCVRPGGGAARVSVGGVLASLHHSVFRPLEDYKPGQHCRLYSNLHKHSNRGKVIGEAERVLGRGEQVARMMAFITWLVELGYATDDPSAPAFRVQLMRPHRQSAYWTLLEGVVEFDRDGFDLTHPHPL